MVKVYDKYKDVEFLALREQLDVHFDERHEWFWRRGREGREVLKEPPPVELHPLRLEFDIDVIKAVEADLTEEGLRKTYKAIVRDMIVIRGLSRD